MEFDVVSRPGWIWPFEKDQKGYIADGKRVDHAGALRFVAKHMRIGKRGSYCTLDQDAFVAFLRECADLIRKGGAK